MQIPFPRALIALLTLSLASAVSAASIKKWVDENGVTHYGTSIPPEYAQKGHVELNERGIPVKKVDRAPTPEEIARRRELEELRKAQERIVEEQRARDRVLLNMFRSEEDLVMVRDGKLAQIDAQIKVKKARIEALKRSLSKWQAKAAARERKGRKPTPKQIENLENIQKQLENTYAGIVEKEADKKRIAQRYAYQLERFRELKRGFRAESAKDVRPAPKEARVIPVEGAYICRDAAQCDRLWPLAKTWTRSHATTPVEVIGERILVTRAPKKPTDISLTVSRLKKNGVERLFLDVSCLKSVSGRRFCQTAPVQALRGRFVEAMQRAAAAADATPVSVEKKPRP
ncbi:MAG TPA: DUF4124 domain-containing protein [Gammaproteobacteria bacterium]|nr:DUF4124 domain-containing protein [Gammaproteobacteria bacterium]